MENLVGIAMVVLFGTLFGLVVPLWLILHYWTKRRTPMASQGDDALRVQRLAQIAERLQRRVSALEAILDNQSPGWREADHREPASPSVPQSGGLHGR